MNLAETNSEPGTQNKELRVATYFDRPAKLVALRSAATALIGTPFFANSEAPGPHGGMDCVHTLNWLYRSCGVIGPVIIPRQHMDAGAHTDHSALIDAFETWPALKSRFACVWKSSGFRVPSSALDSALQPFSPSALLPGDALCFLAGRVPHHGGVVLEDSEFLHTLRGPGVHTMRLDAVLRGWQPLGLLAAVYRPLPLSSIVPRSEFRVPRSAL